MKAQKYGNSHYLHVPADFWKALGFDEDCLFSCYVEDDKLVFVVTKKNHSKEG